MKDRLIAKMGGLPLSALIFTVSLLLQSVFTCASWGLGPVTFGPEFTFFDPSQMGNSEWDTRVIGRMKQHLVAGQMQGAKFKIEEIEEYQLEYVDDLPPRRRFHFFSPNGWTFLVSNDPGVMEVEVTPGTVDFFRQFKNDMQDAIFASAANEGFFPALFQGGGHLNVGMSAFEGNDLLLRNFVVDTMINHNELFLGVLSYDTMSAGSFSVFKEKTQLAIYNVIERFDRGEFTGPLAQEKFLKEIQGIQSYATDNYLLRWHPNQTHAPARGKRVAVNFSHVDQTSPKSSRIEIRGVRPQASMDVWVRQIDLIYHRLLYLEKIKTPIPILWQVGIKKPDFVVDKDHIDPPVHPPDALRAFYKYVRESGLRWQDNRDYLWPKWLTNGDVDKFERSPWFLRQEALKREQSPMRELCAIFMQDANEAH